MIADKENAGMNPNVMMFSPPKAVMKESRGAGLGGVRGQAKESVPSLTCAKFSSGITLEFGSVQLNKSHTMRFSMLNPDQQKSVIIETDKGLESKGFSVVLGDDGGSSVTLAPNGKGGGVVTWTPRANMTVSKKLGLKLDGESRLQIKVCGIAGTGKDDVKPVLSRKALAAIAPREVATKQSNTNHTKQQQTSVNLVARLEDTWASQQQAVLTSWFNEKMNGNGNGNIAAIENGAAFGDDNDDIGTNQPELCRQTSNDLRALRQEREEAEVLKRAVMHYNDADNANAIFQVVEAVEVGVISLRADVNIHKNLSMREDFVNTLLSFELPYLKLGLEVVFDQKFAEEEPSPCTSDSKKWRSLIRTFIAEHILDDVQISSKYTAEQLLHQKYQQKRELELRVHLVQIFLLLVLVMDNARVERYLSLPTLFRKNAAEKTSKGVLRAFSRQYLSCQGDFARLLEKENYRVSFEQSFYDEVSYQVSNLATDLCDGVRLCKLVDKLSGGETDLMSRVRPHKGATSMNREHKLHNVDMAFDALFEGKYCVKPKDVVDGNREATMLLLWRLMQKIEERLPVSPSAVRAEARRICKNKKWRKSVYPAEEAAEFVVPVDTVDKHGLVTPAEPTRTVVQAEAALVASGGQEELEEALVQWCNAVAGQYGCEVLDLEQSLGDGRALCFLIHHYHPRLLSHSAVKLTSADLGGVVGDDEAEANERSHFAAVKRACTVIGGMPQGILGSHSYSCPPTRDASMLFLGYLFNRLMVASDSINAAIRLQRWARRAVAKMRWLARVKAEYQAQEYAREGVQRLVAKKGGGGITDVSCTISLSKDSAAMAIQRVARVYIARQALEAAYHAREVQLQHEQEQQEQMEKMLIEAADALKAKEREEEDARMQAEAEAVRKEQEQEQERIKLAEEAIRAQSQADALRVEAQAYEASRRQQQLEDEMRLEVEARLREERLRIESEVEQRVQATAEQELTYCRSEIEESAMLVIEESKKESDELRCKYEAELAAREAAELALKERLVLLQDEHARKSAELDETKENLAMAENREEELIDQLEQQINEKEAALCQSREESEKARRQLDQKLEQIAAESEHAEALAREQDARREKDNLVKAGAVAAAAAESRDQLLMQAQEKARAELEQERAAFVAEKEREVAAREAAEAQLRQMQLEKEQEVAMQTARCNLATSLQAVVRGHAARAYVSRLHMLVTLMQSTWRAHRAVGTVTAMKQAAAAQRARSVAATQVQSVVRGAVVRGAASPAMTAILVRVRKLNGPGKEAQQAIVEAVASLRDTNVTVESMISACESVKSACVTMGAVQTLLDVHGPALLLNIVRSCNRSAPQQHLLGAAMGCLLAVVAHAKGVRAVAAEDDCVATLLDLLQMFRDKRSLFVSCCSVLVSLTKAVPAVQKLCAAETSKARIAGICTIVERKHRLDERMRSVQKKKKEEEEEDDSVSAIHRLMVLL